MLKNSKLFENMIINNWVAVVYANLDGIIEFVNSAANELYGYEGEELIGKHVDVFNGRLNYLTDDIHKVIEKKGSWTGEVVHRRKDGSIFDALLTVKFLYDENKNPIGFYSNSKDISAEIIDRIFLVQSEEHYRALIENLPIRMMKIDNKGRIIYSNSFRKYNPDQLLNKLVFDFVPPEYVEILRENVEIVFNEKREVSFFVSGLTNGTEKQEVWYFLKIVPVINENVVEFGIIIFEDISEKKKIQQTILNKQAQLAAIINNTNDIVLSIDENYNLVEFNNVYKHIVKLGYNIDLQPGMSVLDSIDPKYHQDIKNIYERVFNGEQITAVEMFLPRNKKVYFETYYNPIKTGDKVTGIAIFSRDITQKVETETDLRQALKEKEVLLAEVHHRVKNNLSVISGILQLQAFNTENEEFRQIINDCTSRIKTTALVHEKLYENNSLSYINFKNYLDDLIFDLGKSYSSAQKNIKMDYHCDEISIDLKRAIPCGLLLNEMITNSYKHAFIGRDTGKISISVNLDENKIALTVKDDGPGFKQKPDIEKATTTGMLLIKTFSCQLDAELKIVNSPNTAITVTFDK